MEGQPAFLIALALMQSPFKVNTFQGILKGN